VRVAAGHKCHICCHTQLQAAAAVCNEPAANRTPAAHVWPGAPLQHLHFPLCWLLAAASAALAAIMLLLLLLPSLLHTWPEYTPSGAMVRVFCSLYLTGSRYTTCNGVATCAHVGAACRIKDWQLPSAATGYWAVNPLHRVQHMAADPQGTC
jgi:hypothetical protein